jgi:hypothetical protein
MKKRIVSTVLASTLFAMNLAAEGVVIKSKAAVLKFSGTHYLGFVHEDPKVGDKSDYFETRRNYLQVKAYINDNPKDYMRVTLDTHNEKGGEVNVRLKYAYLYLDNVLPNTGVEFGQVHRPWIDYEEHHGWLYRSIAKTFVEEHSGAHFTNSADKGINFKTKTDNFSSEIGLFNGEGYHGSDDEGENGLSFEWRLTASLLGTGKKHLHTSDRYTDISFFGQYNTKTLKDDEDFVWYGVHAVYNEPRFLVAGIYVSADDAGEKNSKKTGDGYSFNGEFRFDDRWTALARYDYFEEDSDNERKEMIAGLSYRYSKHLMLIGNIFNIDESDDSKDEDRFMLSAEVKW